MNTIGHVKIFVKDTVDLWKYEAKYIKGHWKGLVIISGVVIGTEIGAGYYQHKKWQSDMKKLRKKAECESKNNVNVEYEVE